MNQWMSLSKGSLKQTFKIHKHWRLKLMTRCKQQERNVSKEKTKWEKKTPHVCLYLESDCVFMSCQSQTEPCSQQHPLARDNKWLLVQESTKQRGSWSIVRVGTIIIQCKPGRNSSIYSNTSLGDLDCLCVVFMWLLKEETCRALKEGPFSKGHVAREEWWQ